MVGTKFLLAQNLVINRLVKPELKRQNHFGRIWTWFHSMIRRWFVVGNKCKFDWGERLCFEEGWWRLSSPGLGRFGPAACCGGTNAARSQRDTHHRQDTGSVPPTTHGQTRGRHWWGCGSLAVPKNHHTGLDSCHSPSIRPETISPGNKVYESVGGGTNLKR